MKKIPISVERISGKKAHFLIPSNLDPMEVRGIVESVMETILLESLARQHYDELAKVSFSQRNALLERGEHE